MTRTAFLVEDNPIVRDKLTLALRECASVRVVAWAADEAAALEWLLDAGGARCDLVIVDLFIDQGSGLAVLEKLAGQHRADRIVVLTNCMLPELRQRCRDLGARRVFDKSRDLDELLEYCAEPDDAAERPVTDASTTESAPGGVEGRVGA